MSRRRKKKKRNREAEALQVELLADAPTEEQTPSAPSAGSAGSDQSAPSALPPEGGDRWAKAVGQLKGTRPRPTRRPEPDSEPREGPASGDRKVNDEEVHATARDHAAASVRPAGEPLARARELVERGRIQEAIQLYLGILTVNPSNLKAHNNLGVLYDELKRYDAALEHFEAAAGLAPENVEVLANFASTLTSLAKYERAEEMLRRAQRLSPEDVQARLGIGILYFRRGLYAQAEAELAWVCSREESNGGAYYYRGEALNRLGRFDEAVQALERAAELIPTDPRPFYTLGHLYDRRYQLEDAAEMYRRARTLQHP